MCGCSSNDWIHYSSLCFASWFESNAKRLSLKFHFFLSIFTLHTRLLSSPLSLSLLPIECLHFSSHRIQFQREKGQKLLWEKCSLILQSLHSVLLLFKTYYSIACETYIVRTYVLTNAAIKTFSKFRAHKNMTKRKFELNCALSLCWDVANCQRAKVISVHYIHEHEHEQIRIEYSYMCRRSCVRVCVSNTNEFASNLNFAVWTCMDVKCISHD